MTIRYNIAFLTSFFYSVPKLISSERGQSLAEFAVITAMMATFVTTSLPKFSNVMEVGKSQKSIEEMDKLLVQAKNFYETTAKLEGRGRLPGQDKFNMRVGSYNDTLTLYNDLKGFITYSDQTIGSKWVSVFGKIEGSVFQDDTVSSITNLKGETICSNCPAEREKGSLEWYELFNREIMNSPFQDGHFIYVVIPGSGTGKDSTAPRICVADAENPRDLHKIMDL